jgi:hypothetical protein
MLKLGLREESFLGIGVVLPSFLGIGVDLSFVGVCRFLFIEDTFVFLIAL